MEDVYPANKNENKNNNIIYAYCLYCMYCIRYLFLDEQIRVESRRNGRGCSTRSGASGRVVSVVIVVVEDVVAAVVAREQFGPRLRRREVGRSGRQRSTTV